MMYLKLRTYLPHVLIAFSLLGSLFCRSLCAQDTIIPSDTYGGLTIPIAEVGAPAGSHPLSGLETVNLYNGMLNVNVPLLKIGGRGDAGYTLSIPIQQGWGFTSYYDTTTNTYSYSPYQLYGGVDPYSPGTLEVRSQFTGTVNCNGNNNVGPLNAAHTLTTLAFVRPDGTTTNLVDQQTGGASQGYSCAAVPSRGTIFQSRDGSDMTFIADSTVSDSVDFQYTTTVGPGTLILRNGTRYRWQNWTLYSGGPQVVLLAWIRDRNGNQVTFNYDSNGMVSQIADSLNRVIKISRQSNVDTITYYGAGGATRTITVNRNGSNCLDPRYSVETSSQLFGSAVGGSFTPDLCPVQSIGLPNGESYSFLYDSFAEVAQITLPTGGVIKYTWGAGGGGGYGDNGGSVETITQGVMYLYRRVLDRGVYADGQNLQQHTAYGLGPTGGSQGGVAVDHYADAAGTIGLAHEVHYFYGNYGNQTACPTKPAWFPSWIEGKEYQTDELSADGKTVLRSIVNTWQQGSCAPGDLCLGLQTTPTCSLGSNATFTATNPIIQQTQTTLGDTNQVSLKTYGYDSYSNRTDIYEYDYGAGRAGPLLRHTVNTYVTGNGYDTITGTSATATHLPGLIAEQKVYNGSAAPVADTLYCYDQQTGSNCRAATNLSPVSNVSGFVDPGNSQRGNVATAARLVSGGTYVQTSMAYDATGRVVSTTDGNNVTTTYSHGDRFSAGTPNNSDVTPCQSGNTTGCWQTQFPLPCSSGCVTSAFLTQITNPVQQNQNATYDYYIGEPTSVIDAANNNATTGYTFNDPLDRLKTVTFPDNNTSTASITYNYLDSSNTIQTFTLLTIASDPASCVAATKENDLIYDGLGRTNRTVSYEAIGSVYTDTVYDGLGRVGKISNPYLANSTAHWTTTTYDGLNRVSLVQTDDGAAVNSFYSGNQVTVVDQAGKWRQSEADAAGRLTQVIEDPVVPTFTANGTTYQNPPSGSTALNQVTSYQYDALNDLTGVCQGGSFNSSGVCQSGPARTFQYDGLKRLFTAQNPESGTIQYGYDSNGNLHTRQDTRFTTTLSYDKLNRLIQKSYTDPGTPSVSLCYDGQTTATSYDGTVSVTCSGASALAASVNPAGRLTFVTNGTSSSAYIAFDAMGRVLNYTQTTGSTPYPFSYTYNLGGQLEIEKYPSNRAVATCYDKAERPSTVKNGTASNAPLYATVNQYTPHGAIQQMTLGNNLVEDIGYDPKRLQPTSISAGSLLALAYTYAPAGSPAVNNGNVQTQTITAGSTSWQQTYTYDQLNRILSVQENGASPWSQNYQYDAYGNFWVTSQTTNVLGGIGGGTPQGVNWYASANNQASDPANPWHYDAAGNLLQIPASTENNVTTVLQTFNYDAENRQVTATINGTQAQYAYDGEGRRVTKTQGMQTTTYVYDAMGVLVAEYGPGSTSLCGTPICYQTQDSLGSLRLITDSTGAPKTRYDYLPFGGELVGANGRASISGYTLMGDGSEPKFTGQYRDYETGLDYFGARYFSAAQGRFTTPDWSGTPQPIPYADLTDPQTLNLYSYVRNNPLSKADPDGHCGLFGTGEICASVGQFFSSLPDRLIGGLKAEANVALGVVGVSPKFQPSNAEQADAMGQIDLAKPVLQTTLEVGMAMALPGPKGEAGEVVPAETELPQEKPTLIDNPKHHPNSDSPQPKNASELFENSIVDKNGVRWAKDADGTIHRFSAPSNGQSHRNGSTAGPKPIRKDDIPIEIRRQLK